MFGSSPQLSYRPKQRQITCTHIQSQLLRLGTGFWSSVMWGFMELVFAFPFKSGKVYYAGPSENVCMFWLVANSFFFLIKRSKFSNIIVPTKIFDFPTSLVSRVNWGTGADYFIHSPLCGPFNVILCSGWVMTIVIRAVGRYENPGGGGSISVQEPEFC